MKGRISLLPAVALVAGCLHIDDDFPFLHVGEDETTHEVDIEPSEPETLATTADEVYEGSCGQIPPQDPEMYGIYVGCTLNAVTVGDLNGDGHVDIAGIGSKSENGPPVLELLLADGAGNFAPRIYILPQWAYGVTTGDFNGDGVLDLVTSGGFGPSIVWYVDGDGGVAGEVVEGSSGGSEHIGTADVNGDGNTDILSTGDSVRVFLGDGTGTFGPPRVQTQLISRSFVVADIDGDGLVDLVDNFGKVALGDGAGDFTIESEFTVVSFADDLALGDVDGDGTVDAVLTSKEHGAISVRSVLSGWDLGSVDSPDQPIGVALVDLTEDGNLDIVSANRMARELRVYEGDGYGGFAAPSIYAMGTGDDVTHGYPHSPVTGDLDGDGLPDIVTANVNDRTVGIVYSVASDPP